MGRFLRRWLVTDKFRIGISLGFDKEHNTDMFQITVNGAHFGIYHTISWYLREDWGK